MPESAPRVVLVDGTNSIYRAFFAPMTDLRATDGTPTKAVLVFTNMLLKTLREENPDYCAVVFDARGKTFRHEVYPEYKAGREAQPEDLAVQFPLAREIVAALSHPDARGAGRRGRRSDRLPRALRAARARACRSSRPTAT